MTKYVWLLLAGGLGCAVPATAQDDQPKAAFTRAPCESCHGPDANGAGPGPALVPLAYSVDELTGIVRQGIGHMPAIPSSDVSDADLRLVFSYLKRLSTATAAPPIKTAAAGGGALDVATIRSNLDRARTANDLAGLGAIAEQAGHAANEMSLAAAVATWEQVSQSPAPAPESAGRVDEAIARADQSLRAQPQSADLHALVAALCALRLSLKGTAPSPELRTRIGSELDRARALAPDSPRVHFLAGAAATVAPDAAGGLVAAETELRQAQTRLSKGDSPDGWPAWNAADAWAWLGRVLAARGDVVGARRAYAKALEIEPNDLWVTRVLLPALSATQ